MPIKDDENSNIKYLPENYLTKFYRAADAYSPKTTKPTDTAVSAEAENRNVSLTINNAAFLKQDFSIGEIPEAAKRATSIETGGEEKVIDFSDVQKREEDYRKTLTREISDTPSLKAGLTFDYNQEKTKEAAPNKSVDIFSAGDRQKLDGFETNIKETESFKTAEPWAKLEETAVDAGGNEVSFIRITKLDGSWLKPTTDFNLKRRDSPYIINSYALVMSGTEEYYGLVGEIRDNPEKFILVKEPKDVLIQKTTDLVKDTEAVTKDTQWKMFLYNLVPYFVSSVLQTVTNINEMVQATQEGDVAQMAATMIELATSAFGKLQDARYYTLAEFLRIATISYALYQFNMPRGITIKAFKENILGIIETKEFDGNIDLGFGLPQKAIDDKNRIVARVNEEFTRWKDPDSIGGQSDPKHNEVANLKSENAIIYSSAEAGVNRLFKMEDYQPLNYRDNEIGSSTKAAQDFKRKVFSTFELDTFIERIEDLDTVIDRPRVVSIGSTTRGEENRPEAMRNANKGISKIERSGGSLVSKQIDITAIPLRKTYRTPEGEVSSDNVVKGSLYSLGYIHVMPFSKSYEAFDIPFQFNPVVTEGGVQAKYNTTSFLARVGDLQTYINTSSLSSVSITANYSILTDGSKKENDFIHSGWVDSYNPGFVATIENMYRSLVYPAFKKGTGDVKTFEYARPPMVRVVVGGAMSNLLVYPKKVAVESSAKGKGEDTLDYFRNFIVTGVTINKSSDQPFLVNSSGNPLDTMGFEVSMSLVEVPRTYMDLLPDYADYYDTFKTVVGRFNASKKSSKTEMDDITTARVSNSTLKSPADNPESKLIGRPREINTKSDRRMEMEVRQ